MRDLWSDESGATAVEYALMAVLITVVIAVAVTALGEKVLSLFNNTSLNNALS